MSMTTRFFFMCVFFPFQVFAWGWLGHSTVGLIADSKLSPQAKAALQKLIAKSSLSEVANWADSIKSTGDYKQTIWYHFEKIPDEVVFLDHLKAMPDWQKKKGGIITAILMAEKTLREATAPSTEQADALKFMAHFVGDLHQPLHTGRPEDNGGVKSQVTWFGTGMSLHKVWDSGMITTGHEDLFKTKDEAGEVTAADATRIYANYLIQKFANQAVDVSVDVEGWLNQSLYLRGPTYDLLKNPDEKSYQAKHLEELDLQIYVAGMRLAEYMNQIYKNAPVTPPTESLWKNIEKIIGSLEQVISFKP